MAKSVEASNRELDNALVKEALRVWKSFDILDECINEENKMGQRITEIRILAPNEKRPDLMWVIKVQDDQGQRYVAFRSAPTARELHMKVTTDLAAGTLHLKEDKPLDA